MINSKIEWCDHTFNPWMGCTKVSPGCANCYAENLMDKRWGNVQWVGKRVRTSEANWKQPLKWNRASDNRECLVCGATRFDDGVTPDGFCAQCELEAEIIRPRVFCASLADWLDDEVPIEWLADLLDLIRQTPNLDWLLLTKRPQFFRERMEAALELGRSKFVSDWIDGPGPENVWVGTSVEDQARANERIPLLLEIPARVRFLSCEPLLGPVDICKALPWKIGGGEAGIHWVICGGESGPNARPMQPDWARSLRDQCAGAEVPFLFKQWGEHVDGKLVGKKAAGRELDGKVYHEFPSF